MPTLIPVVVKVIPVPEHTVFVGVEIDMDGIELELTMTDTSARGPSHEFNVWDT